MQILVAEDDVALAALLTDALVSELHGVTHVWSVDDALGQVQEQAWDVLLLDVSDSLHAGPGVVIYALIQALAARAPVVLITAACRCAASVRPADWGVAGVLRKPFDLEELFECLRTAVRW